jgi:ATP-binding cassette, subfamily C (CFTR/MRP), member 4
MNIIKKMSWIKAISVCCLKLNTRISIFISIIAYILFGNKIKASNIFVLFSLYDLIKLTVVEFFPMSIMFVMDCAVSIKRIQEFLVLPELFKNEGYSCNETKNNFEMNIRINKLDKYNIVEEKNSGEMSLENAMNEIKAKSDPSMGLTMKNVSCNWTSRDTDGNEKIIVALEDINLKVENMM